MSDFGTADDQTVKRWGSKLAREAIAEVYMNRFLSGLPRSERTRWERIRWRLQSWSYDARYWLASVIFPEIEDCW